MATFQDMKDALLEQNTAIVDEMAEVNRKLDELKQDPTRMDEIVAGIKANTEAVKGIINTPLPEPLPEPVPPVVP